MRENTNSNRPVLCNPSNSDSSFANNCSRKARNIVRSTVDYSSRDQREGDRSDWPLSNAISIMEYWAGETSTEEEMDGRSSDVNRNHSQEKPYFSLNRSQDSMGGSPVPKPDKEHHHGSLHVPFG